MRKTNRVLAILVLLSLLLPALPAGAGRPLPTPRPPAAGTPLPSPIGEGRGVGGRGEVQTPSPATPWLNLLDGVAVPTTYVGAEHLVQALETARPLSLAADDFDQDGVPDLLAGYAWPASGGLLALHRGSLDSFWPHGAEADTRRAAGLFVDAPFLPEARLLALPVSPDYLAAGDFDNDGHRDVVAAARGDGVLHILPGDGQGGFGAPEAIPLPGAVTALAAGEVNRRDGLVDLVVGVETVAQMGRAQGPPLLLVFEGPNGALRAEPETIPLPAPATVLAIGQLDDHYALDIAAACGSTLVLVHGRDRALSLSPRPPTAGTPLPLSNASEAGAGEGEGGRGEGVRATTHPLPYAISALALGNFILEEGYSQELALLSPDGVVHVVAPATAAEITHFSLPEPATWNLQPVTSSSNLQLVSLNTSSLPTTDLAVLDPAGQQIHLLLNVPSATVVTLEASGAPAALLPLRLNPDALDDLVVLQMGAAAPTVVETAPMAILTVNETGDQGDLCAVGDGICAATEYQGDPPQCVVVAGCTLRAAIDEANAGEGADVIAFVLPGSGPHVIPVHAYLEASEPVTLDGTTQPGYSDSPIVELTGAPSVTLFLSGGDTVVRGLALTAAGVHGLEIDNPKYGWNGGNTSVEGNYVGLKPGGAQCAGNGQLGISIWNVANNRIGGTTAAARNVIACNEGHGIQIIDGPAATFNRVTGNSIGTAADGTTAQGNGGSGVAIAPGANNDVGGTTAAERNVIAANRNGVGAGVIIAYSDAAGNLVAGNYLGVNKDGAALGNTSDGVALVLEAHDNTIGGTAGTSPNGACTGSCNLISGNARHGVYLGPFTGAAAAVPLPGASRAAPLFQPPTSNQLPISNLHLPTSNLQPPTALTANLVQGNHIGVTADGRQALGNTGNGVHVQYAPGNTVGGSLGAGNVIAGNQGHGVYIGGAAATGNVVQGSHIGVDAPGEAKVPNAGNGVFLDGAPANTIQACLVSGNGENGVLVSGSAASGNMVVDNVIGANYGVDQALANVRDGVRLDGAPGNTVRGCQILTNEENGVSLFGAADNLVGGATSIEQNVISGNGGSGVVLSGSGATGNQVCGNVIGVDLDGTTELGNVLEGVSIEAGAANNTIGGVETGEGNVIAFNGHNGVVVLAGIGNPILGNSIHSNGLLGIDLGGDGITPNDPGDGDDGPNNRQNFPVFTNLAPDGNRLITTGFLSSTAGTRFRIEFFSAADTDPDGALSGGAFLGATEVLVGSNGYGDFDLMVPFSDHSLGLTASATRLDGSGRPVETSEFTPVDTAVVGVEVTQVIQDLSNAIELVAKKPTYALVHARVFGPLKVSDIRAQLTGWLNGASLGTITAQPEAIQLVRVPKRSEYAASFHFRLPFEWTRSGQLRVEAEIYAPAALTEADWMNNKETALVEFSTEPTLRARLYRVAWYEHSSDTWYTARMETVRGIDSTIGSIYPTPSFVAEYFKIARHFLSPIDAVACLQVNKDLASARTWDRLWGAVDADVVYLGAIPGVARGLASPLFYVASVGEKGSSEWVNKNGAHEVGHIFGRAHTCTPGGGESGCDDSYPYPRGELSWTPTGGPMSDYASTIAYGYDRTAANPLHTNYVSDLMSYGVPTRWMSDYTWNGIRVFRDRKTAAETPPLQPPGEYLLFSGRISLTQGAALLNTFYRVPDLPAQPAPIAGPYALRLLDAGGGELATYPFAAETNQQFAPEDDLLASFVELVPYVTGTAQIQVLSATEVLAARLVSSAAPTVTILYPAGGEDLTGTVTISWTVADGDGGPLTATLFYSADDGGTWNALAIDWSGNTFPLDALALPGSAQARLRVLVSDGVNTGQATTPAFQVQRKPPQAAITMPADGAVYAPGAPVALLGSAWDQEDGTLTGTALLWTDSVSGTLGTGEELLLPGLAAGPHTITLIATDGDGMTGTASVAIRVGYYTVALPLVTRGWPPAGWYGGCVDCPIHVGDITPDSLAVDDLGRPHVAYGGDALYYAWHDGVAWQVETADCGASDWAALTLDDQGQPHVSYFDPASGSLRYAYRDGGGWHTTVAYAGGGWGSSIALDAQGRPHVAFRDVVAFFKTDVLYATWDGAAWQVETVDTKIDAYPLETSLALDAAGIPHVGYGAGDSGVPSQLKHAYRDVGGWEIEVVDTAEYIQSAALALDAAGRPHLAYSTVTGNDNQVRYAHWDGLQWQLSTVAATSGYEAMPYGLALAFDGGGLAHFAYFLRSEAGLRHAYGTPGGWQFETVESGLGGMTIQDASALAVDGTGRVHAFYLLGDYSLLRYAVRDGGGWQAAQTVAQGGDPGRYASLALDAQGYPHVAYVDEGRAQVRYAFWDGSGWQHQVVDQGAWAGLFNHTSLVLDGTGRPHIAYNYDEVVWSELRYAYWDGAAWQVSMVEGSIDPPIRGGVAIGLDDQARPHIAYSRGNLRHAYWDGRWQFAEVDSARADYVSLQVDAGGVAHLAYQDADSLVLKYGTWAGGAWQSAVVDDTGSMGQYVSLALDGAGRPHVVYYDLTGQALRYGYREGGVWQTEEVLSGDVRASDITIDGAGRRHVVYYDYALKDLWYAWWGP